LKYLFVLGLLAFAALLIYLRLRPYIRGVRRFLGVIREVNRMSAGVRSDIPRQQRPRQQRPEATGKLVRCAACGTWIPASSAVTLRATDATFCSHACLERSAYAPRRARKSASLPSRYRRRTINGRAINGCLRASVISLR